MYPIVIIRHPKERLSKCSLQPLKGRQHIQFLKATDHFRFDATGFIVLAIEAPLICKKDAALTSSEASLTNIAECLRDNEMKCRPVLLLDSTWRLLPQLNQKVFGKPIYRSLPTTIKTAYPRISKIADDPTQGLASVEALYLAIRLLGHDDPTLLNHYHWRDPFMQGIGGLYR